jgi:hypothetical protein
MNNTFYYVCNLDTLEATDYRQLPDVWGNISAFNQCSDETLADLSWTPAGNVGWLQEADAITAGISQESMDTAKTLGGEAIYQNAKKVRTTAVENIKVTTTAGNEFDGDEVSQGRMARAIIALQITNTATTYWVLSNNSVIEATIAELGEALALAGAAQTAMWVIPT